jgi:hypothetical protein
LFSNDEIVDDHKNIRSKTLSARNAIDEMLDVIWMTLFQEWSRIAGVGEPLYPIYAQLVTLYRQMELLKHVNAYTKEDLTPLRDRLYSIEASIVEKNIVLRPSQDNLSSDEVTGEAILSSLLNRIRKTHFLVLMVRP